MQIISEISFSLRKSDCTRTFFRIKCVVVCFLNLFAFLCVLLPILICLSSFLLQQQFSLAAAFKRVFGVGNYTLLDIV